MNASAPRGEGGTWVMAGAKSATSCRARSTTLRPAPATARARRANSSTRVSRGYVSIHASPSSNRLLMAPDPDALPSQCGKCIEKAEPPFFPVPMKVGPPPPPPPPLPVIQPIPDPWTGHIINPTCGMTLIAGPVDVAVTASVTVRSALRVNRSI